MSTHDPLIEAIESCHKELKAMLHGSNDNDSLRSRMKSMAERIDKTNRLLIFARRFVIAVTAVGVLAIWAMVIYYIK